MTSSPEGVVVHEPRFFTVAASAIALPLLLLPALLLARPADLEVSGSSWRGGFLSGETVTLDDAGTYRRHQWCDVCMPRPPELGRWQRDGRVVALYPLDTGKPVRRYERVLHEGCSVMVSQGRVSDGRLDGLSDLVRVGDACPDAVADARERRRARVEQP